MRGEVSRALRFPSLPGLAAIGILFAAWMTAAAMIAAPGARWRRVMRAVAPAACLAILLMLAPGCGVSYPEGDKTQTIYSGTPAGTYKMMVTSTAQGATRGVNVILIVLQ